MACFYVQLMLRHKPVQSVTIDHIVLASCNVPRVIALLCLRLADHLDRWAFVQLTAMMIFLPAKWLDERNILSSLYSRELAGDDKRAGLARS
jgi:hypothetical protein